MHIRMLIPIERNFENRSTSPSSICVFHLINAIQLGNSVYTVPRGSIHYAISVSGIGLIVVERPTKSQGSFLILSPIWHAYYQLHVVYGVNFTSLTQFLYEPWCIALSNTCLILATCIVIKMRKLRIMPLGETFLWSKGIQLFHSINVPFKITEEIDKEDVNLKVILRMFESLFLHQNIIIRKSFQKVRYRTMILSWQILLN